MTRDARLSSAAIEALISEPRVDKYRSYFPDGDGRWAELYEWNLRLSAALWKPIALVEVGVRNALARRMSERHARQKFDGSWLAYPEKHRLSERSLSDIEEAVERASRPRARAQGSLPMSPPPAASPTDGQIIAELSFSFWRFLVAERSHQHLWTSLLPAFPHAKSRDRKPVAQRLQRINDARNRIAHHDPIWNHDPDRLYVEIMEVASWLDADFGRWVESCCPYDKVAKEKPAGRQLPL